jgi:hypothetical protein
MDKYIDLNRSFTPIPRGHEWNEEEDTLLLAFEEFGLSENQKWDQLLSLPRVVILAEAGTGKTKEIQATTDRLRKEKKSAYCLNLDYLGPNFQNSFERGTEAEFESWLSSEEEGWFFLDSVDEAKLIAPRNFKNAIRSFGNRLGQGLQRAHIFITSRLTEWYPQSDLALVKESLSYNKQEETREEEGGDYSRHVSEASSDEVKFTQKESESLSEPAIFL